MTYVQQLLLDFNSNIQKNSELIDYINQKNFFSMIGKDRNEMVHSKMIDELLCGAYYQKSSESTLMHFLDAIVRRASIQKTKGIDETLMSAILTRQLEINEILDHKTEYTIKTYVSDVKRKSSDSLERLDLYIRIELKANLKNRDTKELEIFIENKVDSLEHSNQTKSYYEACKRKRHYQLFVFLTPIASVDLDKYGDDLSKPNENFVWVNYQDLLDYVIEPMLDDEVLGNPQRVLLKEYVRCLELPAMPDQSELKESESASRSGIKSIKSLSIMATSSYEKELVGKFLQDETNRRVLDAVVLTQGNQTSYTVNNTEWLSLSQAVEFALHELVSRERVTKVLNAFGDVFKKGGSPFLIYVPNFENDGLRYVPTNLYAVNGCVFKTKYEAICVSFRCLYVDKKLSYKELSAALSGVFAKKTLPVLSDKATVGYDKIVGNELYIRNNISSGKYDEICLWLKNKQFDIELVSEEHYIKLVRFGNYKIFLRDICANADYRRLANTNYFYRIDIEKKVEVINYCLMSLGGPSIVKNTGEVEERNILKTFYFKHKSLFLSVYKIMMESIRDDSLYQQRRKEFNDLLKMN